MSDQGTGQPEPKRQRVGPRMRAILDVMANGKTLNRFFEGGTDVYIIEDHGEVPAESVQRLLEAGKIEPLNDAMFGVNYSYRIAG